MFQFGSSINQCGVWHFRNCHLGTFKHQLSSWIDLLHVMTSGRLCGLLTISKSKRTDTALRFATNGVGKKMRQVVDRNESSLIIGLYVKYSKGVYPSDYAL